MKVLTEALMELEMDLMHIGDIVYMFQGKEEDLSAKLLSWINDSHPTKEEIRRKALDMAYPEVEYRNEFHKQYNETCERENARMRSIRISAEYARAQSRRMDALIKNKSRMEQLEGKRRRKKEFTDEDIKKEIKELDNIIAECNEILKIHKPCERKLIV